MEALLTTKLMLNHSPGPWGWRLTVGGNVGEQYVTNVRIGLADNPFIRIAHIDSATAADAALMIASPDLLAALVAVNNYFKRLAELHAKNEGKVSETTTGGAVIVAEGLDELADEAGRLLVSAFARLAQIQTELKPTT